MENRTIVRIIAPLFSLGFFLLIPYVAFAYSVTTHAFLTDEMLDFYNRHFEEKISDELYPYIIEGSRQEDKFPRFFNHFYDPVNKRGLTFVHEKLATWPTSKEWVNSTLQQNALQHKGSQDIAMLLTASQIEKVRPVFWKSNYTWDKAIQYYAEGEVEQAMYTLGHTLHLIEDLSVPEHTRNDVHVGDSPYENWTKENYFYGTTTEEVTNWTHGKNPIVFDGLDEYFEVLAIYSNRNFYSKDSILKYIEPQPIEFIRDGRYVYGFNEVDSDKYRLVRREGSFLELGSLADLDFDMEDEGWEVHVPEIVHEYFQRLSVKALQHGAGVINLFFKEAEIAKEKYEREKAQRPFLGTLIDGIKAVFGGGASGNNNEEESGSLIAQIPLDDRSPSEEDAEEGVATKLAQEAEQFEESLNTIERTLAPLTDFLEGGEEGKPAEEQRRSQDPTSHPIPTEIVELQLCSFGAPTLQGAPRSPIIINEVAWMGTDISATDEWIELKNNSGSEVDISGWQLVDLQEEIHIKFEDGARLAPGSFLLLERTNDDSVPHITADKIYTESLRNAGEGLRLYNSECALIDEVLAAPDWPAGDALARRTMERGSDLIWRHYSGNGAHGIKGTPKQENSPGVIPSSNTGGGGGTADANSNTQDTGNNQESSDPVPEPDPEPQLQSGAASHVVISEVRTGTDAYGLKDEFVELYNPTDTAIDLSGWALKKRTSSGNESNLVSSGSFSGVIAPRSFFLIAHEEYTGPPTADLIYSANSNNLAYINNAVVLYDTDGTVVDEVVYDEITKGTSWERKAIENNACISPQGAGEFLGNGCDTDHVTDFESRATPKPQNSENLPEPRSAPAALLDFEAVYDPGALALVFSWATTSDAAVEIWDGAINSGTLLTTVEAATTTAQAWIQEVGRDYALNAIATDRDGLSSSAASASVSVPSFFNEVYFYRDPRSSTSSPKYLVELDWDESLVPVQADKARDVTLKNDWTVVTLAHNSMPLSRPTIPWVSGPGPDPDGAAWGVNAPNGLRIRYPVCQEADRYTTTASIIIPDDAERCDILAARQHTKALYWGELEDLHPIFEVATTTTLAPGEDYIMLSYYLFKPITYPLNKIIGFVATDATKYYLSDESPAHQPPAAPSEITFEFDSILNALKAQWEAPLDPDTKDASLRYYAEYSSENVLTNILNTTFGAPPGTMASLSLNAIDEFGLTSPTTTFAYEVPEVDPPFGINGIRWGSVGASTTLQFGISEMPFVSTSSPTAMIFFLNQQPPLNYKFEDDDFSKHGEVGGEHSVLHVKYDSCYSFAGNPAIRTPEGGALFMRSTENCPDRAGNFMSGLLDAGFASTTREIVLDITGVLKDGAGVAHDFNAGDFITIGFYELGPRWGGHAYFKNIANYGKRIYFGEEL